MPVVPLRDQQCPCEVGGAPGRLRVCDLAGEGKVLVVKHDGKVSALGTKCSHYGAPLEKGVVANGRVRCPWHGACFSLATGDIEDFPGLDGVPCYQAVVEADGGVRVRARRADLQANKCSQQLAGRKEDGQDVILVLGGGGAGASCVEAVRKSGFTGRLVLATREKHLPYDRPKLSKALDMDAEKLRLRTPEFYKAADIEVLTEHEAESISAEEKKVRFTNGTEIGYTALVVATGSRPRTLDCPGSDLANICVLRSPDDGNAIAGLIPGQNVVIVGTSFIGMEAASYCVGKASSVTVVGPGDVPFARSLGTEIGAMLQGLHEEKGVVVKNGLNVTEFKAGEDGKLAQVVLSDGTELPADVCLLGVGAIPCTEVLKGVVDLDERGYCRGR
ncbi:Apoptosis-inducing factor 3 [Amphibalanus amphitrite]|uniref:Apoptosis-inducing factor 3 n=1 Tax=Amphibalanus amphitrite TaxID=1232801 RepID=A0A6A4WJY7_AMPAM|nr:Apoptosis-inducing factor 3 [Amphibalanus amphitrite]